MSFFIGLWPIIGKNSAAIAAIAGLLAVSWFAPWPKLKSFALWGAAIIVATTIAYNVGVSDGEDRVKSQWIAAVEQEAANSKQAREDAQRTIARDTPDSVRLDPCNRDGWGAGQQTC
jgi:hypothetical protein